MYSRVRDDAAGSAGHVPRRRLVARLSDAARFPLTLVSAGRGYGKSRAVRDFVTTLKGEIVFLSRAQYRTFQEAAAERFTAVGAEATRACTVVIEDGQELLAGPGDVDRLTRLLVEMPRARWIVIVRETSGLPVQHWMDSRFCGPIVDEDELRLRPNEATALAGEFGFAPAVVDAFRIGSRGVPLVFCTALATGAMVSYEDAVERTLLELAPDEREMVFHLCLLPAASAVEPLFSERQRSALARLAAAGLIVSTDASGAIRMHEAARPIVRRVHLMLEGDETAALLKSAAVFARAKRFDNVIEVLRGIGLNDDVTAFLDAHGFDILDNAKAYELRDLIVGEENAASRHPLILALRAIVESHRGRHDVSEAWFVRALTAAAGTANEPLVAYHYALELLRTERRDLLHLLERYAAREDLPLPLLTSIQTTLATAYVLLQRFEHAQEMIAHAQQAVERSTDTELRAKVYHHVAWVAFFSGDIRAARIYGPVAVTEALRVRRFDLAARALSVESNIAYDIDDDIARAGEILDQIYSCGVCSGDTQIKLFALLGRVEIEGERGNVDGLQELEVTLSSEEFDHGTTMSSQALLPAKALCAAGMGDFRSAYELIVGTGDRYEGADRCALRHAEIALYAAAAGLVDEARSAIDASVRYLQEVAKHARRAVRSRSNLALASVLLGDSVRAQIFLHEAGDEGQALSARTRTYMIATTALINRWSGKQNHLEMSVVFKQLDRQTLGGFAALLAALPASPSEALA